ncbi:MAG: glycosyltransferase [Kofleriaceae bacterium]|nr:glycosyltransferase [Kofleriaceae bacterium]
MKPRVLMLTERFPPDIGGLARSGARTAGALVALGAEVDVLAWTRSLPPGAMETVEAGTVADSAKGATLHRLGLFANWDLSMQHTLNVLEWLHKDRDFEMTWGHYLYPAGFLAVMFAASVDIPSTVSARGNDIDQMMFPPGDFGRLMWTLERATARTAVSHDLSRKMDLLLGRDAEAFVVPNSVNMDVFSPGQPDASLRTSLSIGDDEAILGFSGELRHKKGFPFLLDALTTVREERPACLLVIGEVRAREQAHLAAYRAACPEDAARIIVTGRIDEPEEVARHLRLCDVVLQPSVWDGLPNAVLEAMSCERVVLASNAGGIPDAIVHHESGFLIDKAMLNKLGIATIEALDLPTADRRKMEIAARRRIETCFQAGVEAAALTAVLERLLPES